MNRHKFFHIALTFFFAGISAVVFAQETDVSAAKEAMESKREADKTIRESTNNILTHRKELDQLIRDLDKQVSEQQKKIEEAKEEQRKAYGLTERAKWNELVKQLEEDKATAQAKVEDAKKAKAEAETKLKSAEGIVGDVSNIRRQIATSETKIKFYEGSLQGIENDINRKGGAKEKLAKEEEVFGKANSKFEAAKSAVEGKEEAIKTKRKEIEASQIKLNQFQSDGRVKNLQDAKKSVEGLENQKKVLDAEKTRKENRIQLLEKELGRPDLSEGEQNRIKGEIENAKGEVSALDRNILEKEKGLASANESLDKAKLAFGNKEDLQRQFGVDTVDDIEREVQNHQDVITKGPKEIGKLESDKQILIAQELKPAEKELQVAKTNRDSAANKLKRLDESLAQTKEELQCEQDKVKIFVNGAQAKEELQCKQDKVKKLVEEMDEKGGLKQKQAKLTSLLGEVVEGKLTGGEVGDIKETLKAEKESLASVVKDSDQRIREQKIADLQSKVEDAKTDAERDRLQKELDELKAEQEKATKEAAKGKMEGIKATLKLRIDGGSQTITIPNTTTEGGQIKVVKKSGPGCPPKEEPVKLKDDGKIEGFKVSGSIVIQVPSSIEMDLSGEGVKVEGGKGDQPQGVQPQPVK